MNATQPLVIIITGAPGSGKTTLGRRLAQDLDLPLVSRDDFKEILFDGLGWQKWRNQRWSNRLGSVSYGLLYAVIELMLQTGRPFIVESNFSPRFASQEFQQLSRTYSFEPFQIVCNATLDIRIQRMLHRVSTGARHPGHVDYRLWSSKRWLRLWFYSWSKLRMRLLKLDTFNASQTLDLGGHIVELDTTEPRAIAYSELLQAIRNKFL